MALDKALLSGSTAMMILKLLEEKDMYGYQMIDELSKKSDNTFNLKAGTLYPILHSIENDGLVSSYDDNAGGERVRKYYHINSRGRKLLKDKQSEWTVYFNAVNKVLNGGGSYAAV